MKYWYTFEDLYLVHNPCVQRPPENEPKTSEEVIEHNKKLTNPTIPKGLQANKGTRYKLFLRMYFLIIHWFLVLGNSGLLVNFSFLDEKYGQMDYVTLWRDLESMVGMD